jgi:DUF4097 and DUF4098 domain-containing protein YvlB
MNTSARLAAAALVVASSAVGAQQTATSSRAPDFRWEKALAAGSMVSLHNINGDVRVSLSTNGRVEVTGVKHGRYADDVTLEVVEGSRGITVCAMNKNMDQECDEGGLRSHDDRRRRSGDRDWDDASIDIVVKIPKEMVVSASSVSGDVTVDGAEGRIRAGSVSGEVTVRAARATSVRAASVSGDVDVRIENLSGDGDLNFNSVSGNVTAELPKNIDADVTMRSVSGSFDSDFPLTLNGRMNRHSLEARIGKGGRLLEVHTVSGDVRLRTIRSQD